MPNLAVMNDGSEEVALSHPPNRSVVPYPPRRKTHTTYVAERNLAIDQSLEKIDHPLLDNFFDDVNEFGYISQKN